MKTYQDLLKVPDTDEAKMEFVRQIINEHKGTSLYREALIAEDYDGFRNRTIMEYQKLLYKVTGDVVPDNYSANYKIPSRFFNRFITQENQYLLGNGVTWAKEDTKSRLGTDRIPFDTQLQKVGKCALVAGVSFGFFNLDHVEVFKLTEFVPLWDEENGSLSAGVRFWQVASDKPLRASLYEMDGYTEYIWRDDEGAVLKPKRAYKQIYRVSEADGLEIYTGENYPSFPIVPLWGNSHHQSELTGLREGIDCYDLIKSGYANNVDEGSLIYWTITNAGGMDDVDLAQFVERLRTLHAQTITDDVSIQSHQVEVPYASREAMLNRLEKDLYKDAMALNTDEIASGAVTATQIRASYEPLNAKTDDYEYCVHEFIRGILSIAGVQDEASFTRSTIVNVTEEVQTLVQSAQYLSPDYLTRKILTLFGDGDKAEEMLKQMDVDDYERLNSEESEEVQEDTEEVIDE